MNLKFWVGISALIVLVSCQSEEKVCETTRFTENQFTEVKRTNVNYGTAISVSNTQVTLAMDVYTPVGDENKKRPLLIMAHGGSFIGGSRLDLKELCEDAAKKGYVVASIDYRLLSLSNGIPDSLAMIDIGIKASQDMKAAIRFFRKNAQSSNSFGIDEANIYIGGVSAGAITALTAGLLDNEDPIPSYIKSIIDKNGGLVGSSGEADSKTLSNEVKGIVNYSGAVISLNMVDKNDPAIYSIHGDNDNVVPVNYDWAMVGNIRIIKLYGSRELHVRAKDLGLKPQLTIVSGSGHVDYLTDPKYATTLQGFMASTYVGMKSQICGG
jgi:para-nitrobenzyl esterase